MIQLSRTVRFCLNDAPAQPSESAESVTTNTPGLDPSEPTWQAPPRHNAFSAWPPMRGLGRYYQIRVRCAGHVDPATGYFVSIKHIDRAVATAVLPYLQQRVHATVSTATIPMGQLMRLLIERLQEPLNRTVVELRLALTPYYCLTVRSRDMSSVIIRQQYEFAAAHRLHTPKLSDKENREFFGKCNNPSGHGHNYRLEVAVVAPIDPEGHITPVQDLDALIDTTVIQKLDHQHLNVDVPQFARLNPSVENITVVIYDMILQEIGKLGLELEEVSVWETDKTVCTYRGP